MNKACKIISFLCYNCSKIDVFGEFIKQRTQIECETMFHTLQKVCLKFEEIFSVIIADIFYHFTNKFNFRSRK